MIPQITVQLYSVREQAAADYEGTIRAIAAMGFGCVEPAGYPGSSAAKAAKLFQELGLKAPTCHGALPVGDNKNAVIEEALLLGHEAIITGCPPDFKTNFSSSDAVKATAELYCEAAANVAAHGLQIGYHNHDWDLIDVDGTPGYRIFLENTPDTVLWEADVFWVAKAGLDPVAFINEIGPRGNCDGIKDAQWPMLCADQQIKPRPHRKQPESRTHPGHPQEKHHREFRESQRKPPEHPPPHRRLRH